MRRLFHSTAGVLAAAALAATGRAQSLQVPTAPQNHPVAIVNATIHPVSGETIERGYVLLRKGRIAEVGSGECAADDDDLVVHDATGLHVYPGLINADSTVGLLEIGAVRATNDMRETGAITPEVRAVVAVNPDTAVMPVTRSNGILTSLVVPGGGLISGYASVIRMDGWTWEQLAIKDRAALRINWPNVSGRLEDDDGKRAREAREQIDRLDDAFDEASAYLTARDADSTHPMDVRLEAYRPVLEGDAPILVYADDAEQIRSAVAWANRREVDVVIVGGAEAWRCVDLLKAHDVPVVVTGAHRMPTRRDEAYDEPFALPAMLHEAGVRFCIASGEETAHERNLPYHAAMAAAYGLPADEALKAITLYPAQILGVDDRVGAIEEGMNATLIVTTGDPLEITSRVEAAYIDGRRVDLGDKQKSLYGKYRERYAQMGLPSTSDQ